MAPSISSNRKGKRVFPTCFQSKEMKLAVIWRNFSARGKMFRKILNPILARYLQRNIKFCQMTTHENWFNFWSCYNAHTHYLTLQLNRLWIEISATMTKSKPKKKKSNLDSKSRKAKQKKMSRKRQFMDESLSQTGKCFCWRFFCLDALLIKFIVGHRRVLWLKTQEI